jgi:hypothetical protein
VRFYELVPVVAGVLATPKVGEGRSPAKFALLQPRTLSGLPLQVLERTGSAAAWTVAPNRIFNIEWRAVYFSANTSGANFEVRSYEATGAINFIYGEVANAGISASVGVQRDTGSAFTQF